MIFGVDVSKWQPTEAVDGWAFAVLNCEDPGYRDKIRRCEAQRIVWQPYVWVRPGEPGWAVMDRAKQVTEYAGYPCRFVWADYEEAGVTQDQLDGFFARADELGIGAGYYANAHAVDHQPFLGRPFWLAQYPDPNDGTFPGLDRMTDPAVIGRPVQLWQYTSGANDPSGVGLDRNVVIDEAWWAALTGQEGAEDMALLEAIDDCDPAIWPGIAAGSRWVDVETRFLVGTGVSGTPIRIPGNVIGEMAREKDTRNRAAASQLGGDVQPPVVVAADPASLTKAELVAELARRLPD